MTTIHYAIKAGTKLTGAPWWATACGRTVYQGTAARPDNYAFVTTKVTCKGCIRSVYFKAAVSAERVK